jgi:hypothetical protein
MIRRADHEFENRGIIDILYRDRRETDEPVFMLFYALQLFEYVFLRDSKSYGACVASSTITNGWIQYGLLMVLIIILWFGAKFFGVFKFLLRAMLGLYYPRQLLYSSLLWAFLTHSCK